MIRAGLALLLLYFEESGIPLPVPGDILVIYLGHRASSHLALWFLIWFTLVVVIALGATNLYLISRQWGRQLLEGRLGAAFYVTPDRLARAERWFQRWGVWTLILGRHIPGARLPITVAAGSLRIRYPLFLFSVVVSTAAWGAIFLMVGRTAGDGVATFLRTHHDAYLLLGLYLVVALAYLTLRVAARRRPRLEPDPAGRLAPTQPADPEWHGRD